MTTLARHWGLDPAIDFLNHGSFGACPKAVLQEQRKLRDRLEREPVRFFVRELESLLTSARAELAAFVGADPDDLAFVPNATTGVNAVVRSLEWHAGDELLTTDHAYNACRNAIEFAAGRAGARVVVAAVPFPIASPQQVVDAIVARVTDRTRLALVDHVTSPTALIFPVERIVRELAQRGVDALVDGAHAPGMLPLDIRSTGAAYYTGNCHKWLCAPKGAGFLWVRRDRQPLIRPVTISHGANALLYGRSRFRAEFDWTGTDDVTAYLCVPAAIRFMRSVLRGGWGGLMERNRARALEGRRVVAGALDVPLPCPDEMIGAIASLPLPDGPAEPPAKPPHQDPLQDELWARHRIEVPVMAWPAPPKRVIRISSQAYNAPAQYRKLARALARLLRR